jgi:hypothetical protein
VTESDITVTSALSILIEEKRDIINAKQFEIGFTFSEAIYRE